MSLLRFTRPGKPITDDDFVDLGPDTGRTTHTRGMVRGGAIVEVGPRGNNAARDARLRAEKTAKP